MKTLAHAALPPLNEVFIKLQDVGPAFYMGTAAQLVAEGLIPPDFCWPRGTGECSWVSNGQRFFLRRCRPAGHKGPWVHVDYWQVQLWGLDTPDFMDWKEAQRQAKEGAALLWFASPAGRMQRTAFFERVMRARADAAFQHFRARIPALAALQARPARRTRRTAPAGGAA